MNQRHWTWYVILGLFYIGLGWSIYHFEDQASAISLYKVDEALPGVFEGNDWVSWKDTPYGVVADKVHPLPGYKPLDKARIQQGDRIRQLDFQEITRAGVVDTITRAAQPGHVFVATLERPDAYNAQVVEKISGALVINGYRLSFSFNEFGGYWNLSGWIVGIGTFLGLIVLVILIPLVRGSFRSYVPLMSIVLVAFAFFFLQLGRHVYLIVESDLQNVWVERIYMMFYMVLLAGYGLTYFFFKAGKQQRWTLIVPLLVMCYFLFRFYEIVFLSAQLKHYHSLIEGTAISVFLWHIAGALGLFLADYASQQTRQELGGLLLVALTNAVGAWYFNSPAHAEVFHPEHALFGVYLLLFFPLINASFLQLQFGKVSLVVTQTFQYLVTILYAIVLYLLIAQIYDYIQLNIQYRRILEFVTFLIMMGVTRLVYLTNEDRFSRYFVSTQRERLNQFQSFIKRISQYDKAEVLERDLLREVQQYFLADPINLWWNAPEGMPKNRVPGIRMPEQLYGYLHTHQTPWSRNKEIAPYTLPDDLEAEISDSPYILISPITVDQDQGRYAMLMLGRKKRGVYNLADLDLISQLVQQVQLQINVLRRMEREKELIQQSYEMELRALRSQINPHFLFNTLNSITELVHESADRAEAAVEKLAFILRFTTKKSNEHHLPLYEEMSLIRTYLELEQIRFGARLDIRIQVAPEAKDVMVPSFILQTIVENCIKHGISKILYNGFVRVEAFVEGEFLVCEVEDNGPGIDLSRLYKSTGLSNSIRRMENIYDMKNLLYFENTGDGTLVRMRVPLNPVPQGK